jgi:hypothetical protein
MDKSCVCLYACMMCTNLLTGTRQQLLHTILVQVNQGKLIRGRPYVTHLGVGTST